MKLTYAALLSLSMLTSACSTWPPIAHPTASISSETPLSAVPGTGSSQWPASDWWRKYDDSTLDSLIAQGLANAPSIANAEARFNNARESVRISAAASGVRVEAQASVTRQRLSDNGLFPAELLGFSWYNQADLGLNASYSFDWWHKRQAATLAAVDTARAAQAERSAAALALTAAIADSYFGWQADQAQLALMDEQLQLTNRRQQITAARIRAELDPADGQYQMDSELAELHAARIGLETSASLRRVVIAALLGTRAEQLPAFVARPLPAVSAQLPDSVRVDLLSRRADIVASRWRIEAAQQQLRAARAEFMPDISINALAALSSVDLAKLLDAGSAAPAIGAAIHLPIFDSGLLKAQYGARGAQLDAAIASYNDTVITAAREVATHVLSLQQLGAQREQRLAQINAARQLLDAAEARNRNGLTDARPVLNAGQFLQQQHAAMTSLEAAAVSADINLQLALGGGYLGNGSRNDGLAAAN
ncbi:MAG: efflux transporter outer membrane subunit [Steroidobacteraceae bacterium]